MSAEHSPVGAPTAPQVDTTNIPPKPLINPLQSATTEPPSSTIVEPPRSPRFPPVSSEITSAQPNGTPVPSFPTPVSPGAPSLASAAPEPPVRPLADAFPTPAGTSFDPIPSAPETQSTSGAMDIDAAGEADGATSSSGSLKRPGDDLPGSESKRVKEESPSKAGSVPAAPVVPGGPNDLPVDPNAPPVVYPWTNYVEPPHRDPGPTTPFSAAQYKFVLSTIRTMLKSNNSFNFREPVDTVRFNIPHYHQIIPRPMDLGTVEMKLIVSDPRGPPKDKSKAAKWDTSRGKYTSVSELSSDVRQIWENTRKFNGYDHVVSQAAQKLEDTYEKALRSLPPDQPVASASPAGPSMAPPRRASMSQPPVIRRDADSTRPKREIHPPPSKDISYDGPGSLRKPKRRNDPQLQWAQRTLNVFEKSQKYYDVCSPFWYPISEVIKALPVYTEIIKKPIDLLMIKERLERNVYTDIKEIDADLRLLVSNATKFNPPGDAVHNAATALLQLWEERLQTMPPKHVEPPPREVSESPMAEDPESEDEDKDVARLREAKAERAALDREIAELESRLSRKPAPKKAAKPKPAPKQAKPSASRKYSTTTKASPGANGNGVAKKPRKQKEPAYREDDESDDEVQSITIQQKQELAEKIQVAEAEVLSQAVAIIQATTNISGDQEIELDIDSLPATTVIKLYNLVCRGRKGRGKKVKPAARKSGFGGAPGRKHLNEQEEADRIRKMEAQLQTFEGRSGGATGGGGFDEDMSSSEEESSDEE